MLRILEDILIYITVCFIVFLLPIVVGIFT